MKNQTASKLRNSPSGRKEKLDAVVATIQKRWGLRALSLSTERRHDVIPHISSGYPELDNALGIGGIPRGRISELLGPATSGKTTLALTTAAHAQSAAGNVIYIDLERVFDPVYAQSRGVSLDMMTLVHPLNTSQALDMLPDFVDNGGFDLLICDLTLMKQEDEQNTRKLASILGRVLAPLNVNLTTLLFLTPFLGSPDMTDAEQATLSYFTSVRVLLERERWVYHQRDVTGFSVRAQVIKNKLAAPGKQAHILMTVSDPSEGEF